MHSDASPKMVRLSSESGFEGSVEAYWPPLTPEHGFPSLCDTRPRALPLGPPRPNRG